MTKFKALIVHASEFGSTKEVAHVVAEEFFQKGFDVKIENAAEVKQIKQYDAVIIGAAIHYDKWMKEARGFIKRFEQELSTKQVAYFFTCLTLVKARQKDLNKVMKYSNDILSSSLKIKPISVGAFAGVLDYTRMKHFNKFVAKIVFTLLKIRPKDYRRWGEIYHWINETIDAVKKNCYITSNEN